MGDGTEIDPALPWRQIRGEGFARAIGPFHFARAGEREWQCWLAIDGRHLNTGGVCHGGVLLALADVAMGAASFEGGEAHPCATIELGAHFLAAVREGDRALAIARQERRVRELSFMSVEVHAGGRLALRASGIWKYLSSRTPGATEKGAP